MKLSRSSNLIRAAIPLLGILIVSDKIWAWQALRLGDNYINELTI